MASSDEGEIIEDRVEDIKASPLPRTEGGSVNRRDRIDSRRSSAEDDSASRYSASSRRSRSPRGYKRGYDDHDARPRRHDDPARARLDYDDAKQDGYKRPRVSYDDLDGYDSRSDRDGRRRRDRSRDRTRYSDYERDRRHDRPPHPRSRSPYRGRNGHRSEGDGRTRDRSRDRQPGGSVYDEPHGKAMASSASRRSAVGQSSHAADGDAKSRQDSADTGRMNDSTYKHSESSKALEPEEDYVEPEEFDEEAEIERRRRRREELLAKSSSATPLLLHAVGASEKVRGGSPASFGRSGTPDRTESEAETPQTPQSNLASPRSPGSQDPMTPSRMDLADDNALMNTHGQNAGDDEDGPSAADYDPTLDMKEDERRDELRHAQTVIHGEAVVLESTEKPVPGGATNNLPAKAADDGDDFDDFDMFAEDFDEEKYATKPTNDGGDGDDAADGAKGGILEGDDKDGYYKIRIGEVLNGRYQILSTLGRGMFSGVIRALDTTTKEYVAIKMMRNNDALRKGGYTEIAILEKLNDADPENRKHIIKFERSFDYRGHLCMVFENLSMNLREVLRKFGNNVGINLSATRTYAYQMLVSLAHMRKCNIIHADLKPDNILVNESRNVLKICDLGTAIDKSDAATAQTGITPYLVSRFYRAPEIILGMPYDYGVDMWSIGCTLYELYTGKILFTGDSNNQMLKAIMEIRGRLTPKLYKRGQLSAGHFDELGQFVSVERDKVLGKTAVRTLPVVKPTRDLRTRLTAASVGMNEAEIKDLQNFVDLLEQCLALNPDKRIKPTDALKHPFFTARATAKR